MVLGVPKLKHIWVNHFIRILVYYLHHFIIPDNFDGHILVCPGTISPSDNIAEHTLTSITKHSIALVQDFSNTNPYKKNITVWSDGEA